MDLLVISDTHLNSVDDLPGAVLQEVSKAELVVHCGDFTRMDILIGLRKLCRKLVAVHGNADPPDIRSELPGQILLEVEGRKIGVIHPHWGGYPGRIEEELIENFGPLDVILFGHTHDPLKKQVNGTLLLNPGQCYPSFLTPATVAKLSISPARLTAEIEVVAR